MSLCTPYLLSLSVCLRVCLSLSLSTVSSQKCCQFCRSHSPSLPCCFFFPLLSVLILELPLFDTADSPAQQQQLCSSEEKFALFKKRNGISSTQRVFCVVGAHYQAVREALQERGWAEVPQPSLLQWDFCFTMVYIRTGSLATFFFSSLCFSSSIRVFLLSLFFLTVFFPSARARA